MVSSDQPPQEINGLQERLMSRFKSGLVARMDPPGYEMRVAILNRKAEVREVAVPEEVIDYIATVITTNIRELDGAITKVVGYASLLKQAITLDLARAALQEPARPGPAVTVEDILRVVTTRYNVRVSDLQSRKRTRSDRAAAADLHVPGARADDAFARGDRRLFRRARPQHRAARGGENQLRRSNRTPLSRMRSKR